MSNETETPRASKRAAPRFPAQLILGTPIHFLAFGFGSGLAPVAPGTWGTLVAVPMAALLLLLPWQAYLGLCIVLALVGIPICGESCRRLGVSDYSGVVFDEIVAYLWAVAPLLPALAWWPFPLWTGLFAGFVLFRFFDVVKPWPIRWFDRHVHGGLGVMLDDLLAALMTAALLWLAGLWS